ncbi:MAG TPA: hypothetical protein VIK95_06135 [Egibacteraceae bacterium]
MTSTAGGSGPTLVRAERQLGAVSGVGAVRVAAGERPTAADERAAAAQAWLAVARACTAQGADDEAYAAARSGLEELGDAYAGAAVEDDTPLKLAAAEDAHVHGLPHANTAMIRVLEERLAMFFDAHAGRVSPVDDGR